MNPLQTIHNSRSKHGAHISISDDNHHVTDAISSLYDYEGQPGPNSSARPLSFLPSVREEIQLGRGAPRSPTSTSPLTPSPFNPSAEARSNSERNKSNGVAAGKRLQGVTAGGESGSPVGGSNSGISNAAAAAAAAAAEAQFPINNIDYESSPAAVAQELSNLQALRRMSMNVDAAGDPDLPAFAAMPPGKSEDDPSRLFWVPARLHPELAPKEFKSFLDSRVESMKRRSGDFNTPNDDDGGVGRSTSGGGLRRTKSRLSRQIDNTDGRGADGYHDGSELLDRKKSGSSRLSQSTTPTPTSNLNELETLMEDPSNIITRLSLDSSQRGPPGESGEQEDMPIIPQQPGTGSLKRSTRTTYRKGSLRRGERVPGSRRHRTSEQGMEEVPPTPPLTLDSPDGGGLQRSMTDPVARPTSNFSRPSRDRGPSPPSSAGPSPGVSFDSILSAGQGQGQSQGQNQSYGESTFVQSPPTSPPSQLSPQTSPREYRDPRYGQQAQITAQAADSAATENQRLNARLQRSATDQQSPRNRWDADQRQQPEQTLQSMASNPAPLPGASMRTNDLSFIPTLQEDKKADSKKGVSKKRSTEATGSSSTSGSKKSGWSWGSILSSDNKDKDKERKKKKDEAREAAAVADDDDDVYAREKNRRARGRNANDTRLDLLQQQIEGSGSTTGNAPIRGRESLVLDRDQIRLEEARSNERNRKGGKEKDSLLAQIFGKKSKADRETERDQEASTVSRKSGKSGRSNMRPQSPEAQQYVAQIPDADYPWTRFSILEERAIYRMAHIKLANPRRELRSQVLLSNFMYSYLAKVQQMHPQLQIPQSAAQRKQQERQQAAERERQRKESGTPEEYYQYQRYQEHFQAQDAASAPPHDGGYVEDQEYEYEEHGDYQHDGGHDPYAQSGYDYGQYNQHEQSPYQYQQSQFDEPGRRDDDDDMW